MIGKAFAPLATVLLLQLKTVHSAESAYDHAHVFHEEELQSDVCMLQLSATLHKPDQESGLAHEPHHALVRASPCQNSTMNGSLKSASTVPRVMGAKDQYATRKHKQGEDKQNVTSLKSIPMSGKVVRPVKVMHSMLQQEPAEGEAAPAPAGEATPASEGEAAPAPAAPAPAEGEAAPAPAEGEATAPAPAGETTPAAEGEAAPAPAGEATAPAPEGETTVVKSGTEYTITLDRTDGARLGIDVDNQDGVTLLIESINGGLVEKWNKDNPNSKVRPNDRIVEVNGVRDDLMLLDNECKKSMVLNIKLVRGSGE